MRWYIEGWKRYLDFSGRAQRAAYWYFVLFNVIISFVTNVLDAMLGTYSATGTGILSVLYGLAVLIPSISVGARRLHDTGRSGWWLLIGLVPLIGWIILLIWVVQDGEPAPNAYGPNPKALGMATAP